MGWRGSSVEAVSTTVLSMMKLFSALLIVRASAAAVKLPSDANYNHHGLQLMPVKDCPPLDFIEQALLTTAREEFGGNHEVYESAANWTWQRLLSSGENDSTAAKSRYGPHIACAEYGTSRSVGAREASLRVGNYLSSENAVSMLTPDRKARRSCFVATASTEEALALQKEGIQNFGLTSFGPFPTVLKLAPGLLQMDDQGNHEESIGSSGKSAKNDVGRKQEDSAGGSIERLTTTHGRSTSKDNVEGLVLLLSPGVLPKKADPYTKNSFFDGVVDGLMSSAIDLHSVNYWSDLSTASGESDTLKAASSSSALRAREWTRAADVIHGLSNSAEDGGAVKPGDVCSWDRLGAHHPGGDMLILRGLTHLLPSGRGAGGRDGEESEELKAACFMGLVSYLASVPEVLRISPFHREKVLNAVATAIAQSAAISDVPLTDAGLDGEDEVIQVVDSGADQDSCYFVDTDGESVEVGHYFEEVAILGSSSLVTVFADGYFPVNMTRRKIVQYIAFIKGEDADDADYYTTSMGNQYPYYSADGFTTETEGGHGSHTAGTAAGSLLSSASDLDSCDEDAGESLGCVGGCVDADELTSDQVVDIDTFCTEYNCDGFGDIVSCLEEDTETLLASHGGMAQGAKLAIFDVSSDGVVIWGAFAGNGLWDAAEETGAMVHSNSWGSDQECVLDLTSATFDLYMYENPEHLLIFAAGNDGQLVRDSCTISSPGLGKNVLTVGASSSGESRWTTTSADGGEREAVNDGDAASIDTVAVFSSRGPTSDNRIKPEIVAPGDQVLSVSSAGESGASCVLEAQAGTSMATPVVAGAAAMIRQYFKNEDFYVNDATTRGLCPNDLFLCDAFTPSAATIKAILINSANLMGGSSEPDGDRGFGRIHLSAGLPLEGEGDVGLFVANSANTSIDENTEQQYTFTLEDGDEGEFRATLTWLDPSSTTDAVTASALVHDLDLKVIAPSGTEYTMWSSGNADDANVVERVVVSSEDVQAEAAGEWTVSVTSEESFSAGSSQSYSLVVTGPFGMGTSFSSTSAGTRAFGMGRGGGWSVAVRHVCVVFAGLVLGAWSSL